MDVPQVAMPDLDRMAAWLKQNPAVRVQIVGYASATKGAESEARRTSLYRTLAVRKYLVDKGVLSTRMDVRAMGSRTDQTPKDRVEISLPPS
jgi:outer membrane protein OmpA-like peptidoglycan-associated protein